MTKFKAKIADRIFLTQRNSHELFRNKVAFYPKGERPLLEITGVQYILKQVITVKVTLLKNLYEIIKHRNSTVFVIIYKFNFYAWFNITHQDCFALVRWKALVNKYIN